MPRWNCDGAALRAALEARLGAFDDLAFANAVLRWQADAATNAEALDIALRYAAWAAQTPAGRAAHKGSVLFRLPRKLDYLHLVPVTSVEHHGASVYAAAEGHLRRREGFALTDPGTDLEGGLAEAHYCIWCHEQGKDSCAKGLPERKPASPGASPFKTSPFGVPLAGCPLEERISEFHKLRAEGCAARRAGNDLHRQPDGGGHRSPDLQRLHEVVHLPETGSGRHPAVGNARPQGRARAAVGLRDLFAAHALEPAQPAPTVSGIGERTRVLVVGQGPAGFTLAHHLLNDGHTVVAIDGLKIEPLPDDLGGLPFAPLRDFAALEEPLDERVMAGFGGVAEYGITVRWDKNFLKVIRVLLGAARALRAVRRRALRRHADAATARSRSASTILRWRWAPAGRRCSSCQTASPMACAPRRTS